MDIVWNGVGVGVAGKESLREKMPGATRLSREISLGGGEFLGFLLEAFLDDFSFGFFLFRGHLADVVGNFHGAELGPAHGAELGHLGVVVGEGLVMESPGSDGVEGKVELVLPPELEACL